MDLNEIRQHVEILRFCKARMTELKTLQEESRAVVEEALGDNEIGELDGQPVIRYRNIKWTGLDQKALKEEVPEVAAFYTVTKDVRRFEVL